MVISAGVDLTISVACCEIFLRKQKHVPGMARSLSHGAWRTCHKISMGFEHLHLAVGCIEDNSSFKISISALAYAFCITMNTIAARRSKKAACIPSTTITSLAQTPSLHFMFAFPESGVGSTGFPDIPFSPG